jgi:RNA polymerase sigma-70 factor (ECF subfamily)
VILHDQRSSLLAGLRRRNKVRVGLSAICSFHPRLQQRVSCQSTMQRGLNQDEVFHSSRPLLFSIAYRMLGSAMDAEDCVQEAYVRWHQAVASGENVQSPRTYLCTIVTRLCIDQLRSARAQRETYIGVWLPEPLVEPNVPDLAEKAALSESLSMAFLLLLEHLSPVERAVFLLHQVFDYEYAEIAEIVGKSEENCRQIARRARQHLTARRPHYEVSFEQRELLTHQFIRACVSGDMDGLLALLTEDVILHSDGGGKVRAALNPIYGPSKVARGLFGLLRKAPPGLTLHVAIVNGQPGLVNYLNGVPFAVVALDMVVGRIREIDIVVNPDKLQHVPLGLM